jgi:hypothetical protein
MAYYLVPTAGCSAMVCADPLYRSAAFHVRPWMLALKIVSQM